MGCNKLAVAIVMVAAMLVGVGLAHYGFRDGMATACRRAGGELVYLPTDEREVCAELNITGDLTREVIVLF